MITVIYAAKSFMIDNDRAAQLLRDAEQARKNGDKASADKLVGQALKAEQAHNA